MNAHVKDNLDDKSVFVHSKKSLPSPFSLARCRIYLGTHLREELTDLFLKLPGHSLFPHRRSRQRMVNTLLLVNINPILVRYSLEDKSMLFSHFYLM